MTAALTEAQKRVRKGARWLDRTDPDWAAKVEIAELDMGSACRCVLGQVFREDAMSSGNEDGFEFGLDLVAKLPRGIHDYEQDRPIVRKRCRWAEAHGFDHDENCTVDYWELREAWLPEIEKRR